MKFILGQKIGMARVFDADGRSIAVTKVAVFPCAISQIKTNDKDGYTSVQIKATRGDKEKAVKISEFRLDNTDGYKKGSKVDASQFVAGDVVEVTGTSKGKGFAGTIKRHGFKRGPESHGGNNVREPGSIGAQQPQRVVLGRKMSGHMGATTVTVKNLKIVDVDKDILLISGAIPGPAKSILRIVSHSENVQPVEKVEEAVKESVETVAEIETPVAEENTREENTASVEDGAGVPASEGMREAKE